MTAKQSTKAYGFSVLIGVVIAGVSLSILFLMASGGEEAMPLALLLYLAIGTIISFIAGAVAVVLTGREAWVVKGVLACPATYLLAVIWITTPIASDGEGRNGAVHWIPWIPLLVSVLFSILGAAAGTPIRRLREGGSK